MSAAYAFTWEETNPLNGGRETINQVGGSIMHKPSGLGIYAMGEWEDNGKAKSACVNSNSNPQDNQECLVSGLSSGGNNDSKRIYTGVNDLHDTSMWGVKPFWRKAWTPLGATVLYGEFAEYDDFFGFGNAIGAANALPACTSAISNEGCVITGSQVDRWGLGVVQEINSAAMHVWARWQHQDQNQLTIQGVDDVAQRGPVNKAHQSFSDWDLFQVGAIIFF